ncbi:MAG: hypothetical protein ABJA64_00810 [Candidatus Saccharibacteria bacterium]
MKERSEHTNHDFTETIDCGNIRLHVFHPDHLDLNTSLYNSTTLAKRIFNEDEDIPTLRESGLEMLAATTPESQELFGYANFEVPRDCMQGDKTQSLILKRLSLHFHRIHTSRDIATVMQSNALKLHHPTHESIDIRLTVEDYDNAFFELSAVLNPRAQPSSKYEDIVHFSTIWGQVQDFLLQGTSLPSSGFTHDIHVGQIGSQYVSNTEIAIESLLGSYGETAIVPQWGDDINGYVLQVLEKYLLEPDVVDEVAYSIIKQKRDLLRRGEAMGNISQDDIVKAMTRFLPHRDQLPD